MDEQDQSPSTTSQTSRTSWASRDSSESGHEYQDVFRVLDERPADYLPLQHPGTGLPLASNETQCPTFRAPRRTKTTQATSLAHSAGFPTQLRHKESLPNQHPPPKYPSQPRIHSNVPQLTSSFSSYSTSSSSPTKPTPTLRSTSSVNGTLRPLPPPSPQHPAQRSPSLLSSLGTPRPQSTISRSSTTSTTKSTSTSGSQRIPRPSAAPIQSGPHNSIAELQARQLNLTVVQQPISPYAELGNPLEVARSMVVGVVRRGSGALGWDKGCDGSEDGGGASTYRGVGKWKGVKKSRSLARLEGVLGRGKDGGISRNF